MVGLLRPAAVLAGALMLAGCTTARTTHSDRTAKEQLLISSSIDQALDKIDFSAFAGQPVYLEEKYLDGVDKNYVIGSLRHRLLFAGAALMPDAKDAEIIVEVRSGSIGTDSQESFVGSPEFKAPIPVLPVSVPEIKVVSRNTQSATAKIGIVAYDAKTRQILGSGGVTLAQTDARNWYVFGAGPYRRGSLRHQYDQSQTPAETPNRLPPSISFAAPSEPERNADMQWASGEEERRERQEITR